APSASRRARGRAGWRPGAPPSSRTPAPPRGSPAARRCSKPRGRARRGRSRGSSGAPPRDQVRPFVADDGFTALVLPLGPPGDDAEGGTALGFARGEHGAARGHRVARIHRAEELDLVDAEERPARLGEVLDAEPDGGAAG